MARPKFGFKTFIKSKNPIVHPASLFNKETDLTSNTQGLWCYVTTNGWISALRKPRATNALFINYTPGGKVRVYLPEFLRYTTISVESIHTKDEGRPVSEAA